MTEMEQINREKVWGLSFLISVCIGLIWAGIALFQWMQDEQQVPISHIEISGQYRYINENDISLLINMGVEGSFFSADINEIHRRSKYFCNITGYLISGNGDHCRMANSPI